MPIIGTIEDAAREIKFLQNQLNLLRTKNIDISKRRIINASPAIGDNDYVIKSQLDDIDVSVPAAVTNITEITEITGESIQQLDFFISHTIAILTNASQQIYLASDFTVGSFLIAVKSPALGGPIDFKLKVDAIEVLIGTLLQDAVSSGVVTADAVLTKDIPITLDITKVGTTFPGRDFLLSLRKAG